MLPLPTGRRVGSAEALAAYANAEATLVVYLAPQEPGHVDGCRRHESLTLTIPSTELRADDVVDRASREHKLLVRVCADIARLLLPTFASTSTSIR
jgi:hypothetical protein